MTEAYTTILVRLSQAFLMVAVMAICSTAAPAQGSFPNTGDDKSDIRISSVEEEMRVKRALQAADKAHKTNLERARNLASLSATLLGKFNENKCFDREDLKKLEKAEKLAKSIREAAGGSEDRVEIDNPPTDVGAALSKFSETAESLKLKVEKTPKHVVSTAVIDEANVLLELIRIVRIMQPKAQS